MGSTIKSFLKILDPSNAILAFKKLWSLDMQNKDIQNVNELTFNLTPTGTCEEGEMGWNVDDGTLQLGMPGGNVKLQIGQEELVRCTNAEGVQIDNGQAVFISGASGDTPEIQLADADVFQESFVLGIATEDIVASQKGYVAVTGLVRDINTDPGTYSPGDVIWLSQTSGEFTKVRPDAPAFSVFIGYVIRAHASEGIIIVRPTLVPRLVGLSDVYETTPTDGQFPSWVAANSRFELLESSGATKEPTGFTEPENVISTYDSTTRTITLTGTVNAYWKGQRITALTNGWVSSAHDTTLDTPYFLLYDGTSFVWQNTPWEFYQVPIGFVWYGTSDKFSIREPHGIMPWQSHKHGHETTGTYRESGGGLSNYVLSSTTATDRQPSVAATQVHDEDIPTLIPALAASGNYTQMYLAGAGGTNTFVTTATEIVPLSGNQPYWNEWTGATWQQTLISNNDYMVVWQLAAPMTADSGSQSYRYMWVQGQNEYATLLQAQAETLADMNLGSLANIFTEFVFTNKVIILYTAGNWQIVEVVALSGTRQDLIGNPISGVYLSDVTSDSTLSGDGTTTTPLSVNPVYERALHVWNGELNLAVGTELFDQALQRDTKLETYIPSDMTDTYRLTRAYVKVEDLDNATGNNPNGVGLIVTKNGTSVSDTHTTLTTGSGLQVTNMLTNLTAATTWTADDSIGLEIANSAAGSDSVPNIVFDVKFEI